MKLKIAIQKSGRLYDDSVKLLKECGIEFNNGVNRLRSEAINFPLEVLFLRDDDIPQYVADGVADLGIVGANVLGEKRKAVTAVEQLGFARCRLSIAVPAKDNYSGTGWLQGKRIATTYPVLLKTFLSEQGICADIHEISGSVEIAPGIGLADAICDLVSSGSTLFLNGLQEAEVVMRSEAILIARPDLPDLQQQLLNQLLFRIRAVKRSRKHKYILMNVPDEKIAQVTQLLPGIKSPTIMSLVKKGWSSLHTVVQEDDFWDIIENLKEQGAEGILVIPIEKMIV